MSRHHRREAIILGLWVLFGVVMWWAASARGDTFRWQRPSAGDPTHGYVFELDGQAIPVQPRKSGPRGWQVNLDVTAPYCWYVSANWGHTVVGGWRQSDDQAMPVCVDAPPSVCVCDFNANGAVDLWDISSALTGGDLSILRACVSEWRAGATC